MGASISLSALACPVEAQPLYGVILSAAKNLVFCAKKYRRKTFQIRMVAKKNAREHFSRNLFSVASIIRVKIKKKEQIMTAPKINQALQFIHTVGVPGLVSGVETGMVPTPQAARAFGAIGNAIDAYRSELPEEGSLQELRTLICGGSVHPEELKSVLTQLAQHRDAVELAVGLALRIDAVGAAVVSSAAAVVGIEAPVDLSSKGLVWIPPGEFMMGSVDDDRYADSEEKPLRTVMTGGFYMFDHPVTNAEFKAFLEATGREDVRDLSSEFAEDDQPAVLVNHEEATTYSNWLGDEIGKHRGISVIGRLPTEAEWEKAAKGPSGNEFISPATHAQAHFDAQATRAVDSPDAYANGFWLKDMIGNVWEWTSSPWEKGSANFVLRGGSWSHGNPHLLRAAYRSGDHADRRHYYIGFRPVIVLQDSPK